MPVFRKFHGRKHKKIQMKVYIFIENKYVLELEFAKMTI